MRGEGWEGKGGRKVGRERGREVGGEMRFEYFDNLFM